LIASSETIAQGSSVMQCDAGSPDIEICHQLKNWNNVKLKFSSTYTNGDQWLSMQYYDDLVVNVVCSLQMEKYTALHACCSKANQTPTSHIT
jgi:hypothetical protein